MAKADKALAARRVDDILRIRLDGAQFWDVREFVREKEKEQGSAWFLADGETPLSDSQIRRYQQKADRFMAESHERSRKKLLRRHLAQRRNLYARATTTGDLRTALACLRDEGELLGLYDRRPGKSAAGPVERDPKKRLEESLAFWDGVVRSNAPLAERMRAQEHLDRLLGLEHREILARLEEIELDLKKSEAESGNGFWGDAQEFNR
jgi:hypothetical protein